MLCWRILLLLVYFTSNFHCWAATKEYTSSKRMQESPKFKTMFRYGRSSNKEVNIVNVHPRADSFYLGGPRYGKRSTKLKLPNGKLFSPPTICRVNRSCTYLGVSNLYRCTSGPYDTYSNVI
ncbi:RYamide neuropeptides-like [Cylas formicarius]|uniref:RYamide neuropeptides-like n=1 Tax=Cylas formicarius TaxID=197179 RepID=UPI00295845CD|nr:RYamide neuropeptides-like [Cylas formicarius]